MSTYIFVLLVTTFFASQHFAVLGLNPRQYSSSNIQRIQEVAIKKVIDPITILIKLNVVLSELYISRFLYRMTLVYTKRADPRLVPCHTLYTWPWTPRFQ